MKFKVSVLAIESRIIGNFHFSIVAVGTWGLIFPVREGVIFLGQGIGQLE